MKNRIFKLFLTLIGGATILASCDKKDFSLEQKLDASELNFTIVQDYSIDAGGNTVILTNNTPETIAVWDYQTGTSRRQVDTIHYAFAGEYTIQFSALTGGGLVDSNPITITVDEDNLNYVSDPLWIYLSGGPGNEKSWVFDNGQYGLASGAMSYADPNTVVEWNNFSPNWEPEGNANGSTDEDMNWGNYMTFSLDGGPIMTVHDADGNLLEQGTYYLDHTAHTLTTNGLTILRPDNYIENVGNWNTDLKVLTLDDNQLRIATLRTNDEGPWWYIWNFVSKEYADNYVGEEVIPEPDEGYEPTFEPGELLEMLTGGVGSGRVWALDGEGNPVDWITAGNGWTTDASSSYNWGWDDNWAAVSADSWIRFDQWNGALTYTRNQEGVETSGTFTINETTNEITLEGGETLIQNTASWMNPTTSTITVVKAFDDYANQGIWFGTSYTEDSDQWLVWHYVIP